jgi:RimK family alpha-L-glutamate ligase
MRILIVGLVNNEQLKRLSEEGEKRGHKVDGCFASELTIVAGNSIFEPTLRGRSLVGYDLIYLWSVGKRRWEWYTAAYFLSKKNKTEIVNKKCVSEENLYFLTPAIDYLDQVESNIPFPYSAIIFSQKSVDSVIKRFKFPLILKTSGGRQGRGVFKINDLIELKKKVGELIEENPSVVVREFIPNDGDIRIFTVGYKAVGAMKRTPPKGDFRSNISQGGIGENFELNKYPEIKNIAERISEITKTEIAGVDIMINKNDGKPYVLEINPGPQFLGIEKYTGLNIAGEIIKYFESLLKETPS